MISMSYVSLRSWLAVGAALICLGAPQAYANTVLPSTGAVSAPVADPIEPMIGDLQTVTTRYEDTLVHMARKYGVGFVEIRAANPGVDPWMPGAGTRVTIPTMHILPDAPHRGVVINLSEMRLYYYATPDEAPATYPIGIGRSGLTTPLGATTVARKMVDPIWYPTERMRREDPTLPAVVNPGPENPMGTHAMYLGWNSYAIHGTDKPYSIGRRLSSGCIRMYPEDILTLFDHVPAGTMVTVVDQPVKTAWVDNKFYIEVHPTQEQSDILSHDNSRLPDYQMSEKDMRVILKGAGADAESLDWAKIRKIVKERRGIPEVVGSRRDVTEDSSADAQKAGGAVAGVIPAVKTDVAPLKKAERSTPAVKAAVVTTPSATTAPQRAVVND